LALVTLLMFLLSTAHVVITVQFTINQYVQKHSEGTTMLRKGDPIAYVPAILEIINVSLVKDIALPI
jgi:hypothetical protein